MKDDRKPCWADDPELMAIQRRTFEEFERELEERGPAADDARYEDAVRAARAAGLSWGEIGRVLDVPRQLLHRRFRKRSPGG